VNLPLTALNLAGSVGLLLWGVHMVQTGVQRAFGARLRNFLGRTLSNPVRALLAGIGVTAILQSSTATGLMVTGFAADGLVDLVPGLAVMLGANIGTTLIVQALSFNVAELAPVLILFGVIMFRRSSAAPRDFGRVLIGLGLMLMALYQFISVLAPYEDAPQLRIFLGAVATQPVLDVVLAAGLTWATHSSVAIVLVIVSFAAHGHQSDARSGWGRGSRGAARALGQPADAPGGGRDRTGSAALYRSVARVLRVGECACRGRFPHRLQSGAGADFLSPAQALRGLAAPYSAGAHRPGGSVSAAVSGSGGA
jgi:hypothetical protein